MTEADKFVPLTYLRWVEEVTLPSGTTASAGPSMNGVAGYQFTLTHAWIVRELVHWRIGCALTEKEMSIYVAQKCAKNDLSLEESRALLMLLDLDDSVLDRKDGIK